MPPYGEYNHPYLVPAGTPIHVSVARRFDALARSDVEVDGVATVKFIDTRGQVPGEEPAVLMTAEIPFYIGPNAPQPEVFGISGTVTDNTGAPMGEISIRVEPASQAGSEIKTKTLADGTYSAANLVSTMYAVTPSQAGYAFEPATAHVTVIDGNITAVNFIGTPAHAIIGKVMYDGAPLAGVTIHLHGEVIRTVVTDVNGEYRLSEVDDGDHNVVPSLPGYEFTPASATVNVSGADVTGLAFTAEQAQGQPPPVSGGGASAIPGGSSGGCFIDSLRR